MSGKCYSIAVKLRTVAVTEDQSYLIPSIVSGCLTLWTPCIYFKSPPTEPNCLRVRQP